MVNNNRDFVDFLIELFKKKNLFFIILVVLISYMTYFNMYTNDKFKYQTTMTVSSESVMVPIIDNLNVYKTSADVYLSDLKQSMTYMNLSLDLCKLVNSTFVDERFINSLVMDYKDKYVSDKSSQEIFTNLKGSIKKLPSDASVCVNVEISGTQDYIPYMYKYYNTMVNKYLQDEVRSLLTNLRIGKIDYLNKTIASNKSGLLDANRIDSLSKMDLNAIETRSLTVLGKLELLETTELADTNVNFIIWSLSTVNQTLNYIFLYAFAIFLSIIIFVLSVVMIDFKSQYKLRNAKDN